MAGQLAGRGERAGSLGHGRRGDREGTDARLAARAGAPRAGRAGERAPAGAGQRAGRDEPGPGGAGRRHGPADPARLGAPLQRHLVARMQPESSYINGLMKTERLEKLARIKGLAYPCNNAAVTRMSGDPDTTSRAS